ELADGQMTLRPTKPSSANGGRSLRDQPRLVRRNAMPRGTLSQRIEDSGSSVPDVDLPVPAGPRVYVVSDVRLHREGLISSLTRQSELNVVGAGSAGDALSQIPVSRPE